MAAEAPPMPESWQQQPEDGSPQQPVFETASDLIKNPFGMGAAQLLNLMLEMGTVPNAPQLIGDLTPEIILWLDAQDPKFLSALNPGTLRLFAPQVLASLPTAFLETLEPQLRDELAGIAQGTVTVFIPEYVVGHWWEQVLHNQSALRLKSRLLFEPNVMVTSVPWQLSSSERLKKLQPQSAPGDARRGFLD